MCQELAGLGMQLARAAAQRALRDMEQPAAATPAAAKPAARRRARQNPDPSLAFARVSREVRQLITLEIRLAAAPAQPRTRRSRTPTPAEPDTRRAPLHQAVDYLTAQHPQREEIRSDFARRIERRLAADRAHDIPAGAMLIGIADEIGLDINDAEIPEDLYDALLPPRFRTEPAQTTRLPPVARHATGPPAAAA